ncbi:MAG: hypothetical protein BWY99_02718 [Synergistetes bacterium ADurb.BinA166]|nr:MAG: hypothetical protein BWY99_02718 [Synergistetes bacterium ADurb.BinA166]
MAGPSGPFSGWKDVKDPVVREKSPMASRARLMMMVTGFWAANWFCQSWYPPALPPKLSRKAGLMVTIVSSHQRRMSLQLIWTVVVPPDQLFVTEPTTPQKVL